MCGIIGYIGPRQVAPILMGGLKRLDYRGYDSAGVAGLKQQSLKTIKSVGKLTNLEKEVPADVFDHGIGVGHTRWATHGAPSLINAHPHVDCHDNLAVVHNGIIENYRSLRQFLEQKGHVFRSETDTEVLAHLIEEYNDGNLVQAVTLALHYVEGAYGIVVISAHDPQRLIAARHGSPLVVGKGDHEMFVASDVAAILEHTDQAIYLKDGEKAVLTCEDLEISTIDGTPLTPEVSHVTWNLETIEKGGFPHFMLKEIYEQPISLENAIRGRLQSATGNVQLSGLNLTPSQLRQVDRIILTACGTSWHAGLIGEYMLESLARIPVEVEYASEFRYRDPLIRTGDLVFAISQSGETADTLAAAKEAAAQGAPALGICNVVGSSIARTCNSGVYLHAGPEIGVASTKAFTSQVTVLALLSMLMAQARGLYPERRKILVQELSRIPLLVKRTLETDQQVRLIAERYAQHNNCLYLGRSFNFPVALEGALKLKEISYVHAEGYPAAEMKHGPIALIDEHMPVVVIATQDSVYEKVLNNIEEIRARKGEIIAIATENDERIQEKANYVISIPPVDQFLSPLLTVIPLQLLAYHIAVLRGCDVDKPRNLAKSVTVE